MLRPIFLMNRATMFALVKQHTEDLVNDIPINEFVDLHPLLFQLTFDTTTILLFGKSVSSLKRKQLRVPLAPDRKQVSQRLSGKLKTCSIVVNAWEKRIG